MHDKSGIKIKGKIWEMGKLQRVDGWIDVMYVGGWWKQSDAFLCKQALYFFQVLFPEICLNVRIFMFVC